VVGQASRSLRDNQSLRIRPPTDPSRPGVGSHRQQWTWGCFRSWDWGKAEVSAAASVSAVLPPSPVATALPSSPSRWLHGCWTWKEGGRTYEISILRLTRRKPSHQPLASACPYRKKPHTYAQQPSVARLLFCLPPETSTPGDIMWVFNSQRIQTT
jgi:hypothetical protein